MRITETQLRAIIREELLKEYHKNVRSWRSPDGTVFKVGDEVENDGGELYTIDGIIVHHDENGPTGGASFIVNGQKYEWFYFI